MDELSAFERRLAAGLDAYAGPRRPVNAVAITRAAAATSPVRRTTLLGSGRVPWRLMAAAALLVVSLAAGAVFVGSQQPQLPPIIGPAGSGLVAYSSDGDIFVGDPMTGQTTAIVTGPDQDASPRFSPDGTHIAFIRGDPWSDDVTIVVVSDDGSDERVVMPAGLSDRGLGFAWTPDSASIVVNHDNFPFTTPYFDGELSLVDVFGRAEPRLLTPPLPIGPGGPYLNRNAPFAHMFRPPNADVILSGGANALHLWDVDLESMTELAPEELSRFEPYSTCGWCVAWSPDGSMISVALNVPDDAIDTFVMDADGTDVRAMPIGTWSPDSSKMALERCSTNPERPGAVIVVVDIASGDERVLGATSVETKTEGSVPPRPSEESEYCGWYEGPDGRVYDYEGWSWTPDGRSIVMLERAGTRPVVVDVETGDAIELPWEADSALSWRARPAIEP